MVFCLIGHCTIYGVREYFPCISDDFRFLHQLCFDFQVTHRLIVNLPRGQKTILRLNHSLSLKEIFITVCKDKHLDPENFELRHPVHPDEVLNLSRSLKEYGLNEINITNVSCKFLFFFHFILLLFFPIILCAVNENLLYTYLGIVRLIVHAD